MSFFQELNRRKLPPAPKVDQTLQKDSTPQSYHLLVLSHNKGNTSFDLSPQRYFGKSTQDTALMRSLSTEIFWEVNASSQHACNAHPPSTLHSILNTHIFSLLLTRFELRPKGLGLSLVTTRPYSLLLIYIHNKYVKVHY